MEVASVAVHCETEDLEDKAAYVYWNTTRGVVYGPGPRRSKHCLASLPGTALATVFHRSASLILSLLGTSAMALLRKPSSCAVHSPAPTVTSTVTAASANRRKGQLAHRTTLVESLEEEVNEYRYTTRRRRTGTREAEALGESMYTTRRGLMKVSLMTGKPDL